MARKVISSIGKRSKAGTKYQEYQRYFRQHWIGITITAAIGISLIYLFLFEKPKSVEVVRAQEAILKTVDMCGMRSADTISRLPGVYDDQAGVEAMWSSFSVWQRKHTLQQVVMFLVSKDLEEALHEVIKVSSMKSLFSSACPDVFDLDTFVADDGRVWQLMRTFQSGKESDESSLGAAAELWRTVLRNDMWSEMDLFDAADKAMLNGKSWRAVRRLMLARFYFVFGQTMKHNVKTVASGKELKFPPEPEPEPEWKDDPAATNVAHLTADTFDAGVRANQHTIVMFYAPWCGHCKSMKPHMAKTATILAGTDAAGLGAVDCTKEKPLCSSFNVTGFPTMAYFVSGEHVGEYSGERNTYGLLSWLNDLERMNGALEAEVEANKPPPEVEWKDEPGAHDVLHMSDETWTSDLATKRHALVMFYAPWCGHCKAMKPDYAKVATALKEADVAVAAIDATKHAKAAKEFEVKGFPTLVYFRDGQKVGDYNGGRDFASIVGWLDHKDRMNGALKELTPPPPPPPTPPTPSKTPSSLSADDNSATDTDTDTDTDTVTDKSDL